MKWIAELINMIAVVTIITDDKRHRIVTNVKKVHQRIIVYFGKYALDIYGLPPELEQVEINYSNYKNLLHWCEMKDHRPFLRLMSALSLYWKSLHYRLYSFF